ncbi:hypothetical protein ACFSJS_18900 [Streptomyces desertarenae]|uniref:Uncharacterized protein n=1 Tax=Streptomyces desertarenae TaxID=2666184 RepID=A0ABW4PLR6_9ACTN
MVGGLAVGRQQLTERVDGLVGRAGGIEVGQAAILDHLRQQVAMSRPGSTPAAAGTLSADRSAGRTAARRSYRTK